MFLGSSILDGTHVGRLIKLHSSSLAVISVLSGMEMVQGQYCAVCTCPATSANIKAYCAKFDNSLLWAPVSTMIVFAQNFLICWTLGKPYVLSNMQC